MGNSLHKRDNSFTLHIYFVRNHVRCGSNKISWQGSFIDYKRIKMMHVNILFHLYAYNCKNQILINIILSIPNFASKLIQLYHCLTIKKTSHNLLLLDNPIENSRGLIKWSVITKAYNTDNGVFYTT